MKETRISMAELVRSLERVQLVRLSPRDMLRVETLLASRTDWTARDLAASLASLLATDRDTWRQIHGRVRELLDNPAEARPSGQGLARPADTNKADAGRRRLELIDPGTPPDRGGRAPARRAMDAARRAWNRARMRRRDVPSWVWALALAIIVLAALAPLVFREPVSPERPAPEPPRKASPGVPEPPRGPEPPPVTFEEIEPPGPLPTGSEHVTLPTRLSWLAFALGLVTGVLAVVGLHWLLLPRDPRRVREHARKARARLLGQAHTRGVPYRVPRTPPFATTAMDDAATLLGRAGTLERGTRVDIHATIDRTARAAGQLEIVRALAARPARLLVLVDVEKGDHPFLDGVEWVLAHWRNIGLDFERHDYGYTPVTLWPEHGGPATSLDKLGRKRPGAMLVVFSRLLQPADNLPPMDRPAGGRHRASRAADPRSRYLWLQRLAPWPARAIVDLDPRPDAERAYHVRDALDACRHADVPRYPFTQRGLVAAARALATGHAPEVPRPGLPGLRDIEPHLVRWATYAAYVPDPTWSQLEAMRRHFVDDIGQHLHDRVHVQRLIEWVAEQGSYDPEGVDGRRLDMPDRLLTRLVDEQRGRDKGKEPGDTLEWRARTFLMEQLRAAEPPARKTFQWWLWKLKHDFHQAVLEPHRVGELRKKFEGSAVDQEFRRMLEREMELQVKHRAVHVEWPAAELEAVAALLQAGGRVPLRQLFGSVRRNKASRWRPLALAAAGMAFMLAIWLVHLHLWQRSVSLPRPGDYLPGVMRVIDGREPAAPLGDLDAPFTGSARGVVHTALKDRAPMRFIGLTGGEFTMGSPDSEQGRDDDEGPRRRVRIAAFEIAETEVTQAQWRAVMGTSPSNCDYGCGDDLPVQNVTWLDAIEFMNKLSVLEERTPCYDIQGEDVRWKPACTGYRLPTEAEWEYAARAGSREAYSFGDDASRLGEYAWYGDNSGIDAHPVAKKRPNAWGLHDMHGNVWEWAWDWYGPYSKEQGDKRPGEQSDNPRGPAPGEFKVLRGGSFDDGAELLRSALRFRYGPTVRVGSDGFRCARGGAQHGSFDPLNH